MNCSLVQTFFCPISHWSVLRVHLEHIANSNLVLVHCSTVRTCVQLAGKMGGFASSALLLHSKTVTKPTLKNCLLVCAIHDALIKKKNPIKSLLRSTVRVWAVLQPLGSALGCVLHTRYCEASTVWFTIKTSQVVNLAGVTWSITAITLDHKPPLNGVHFKMTNRWHYESPFLSWLRNKS